MKDIIAEKTHIYQLLNKLKNLYVNSHPFLTNISLRNLITTMYKSLFLPNTPYDMVKFL